MRGEVFHLGFCYAREEGREWALWRAGLRRAGKLRRCEEPTFVLTRNPFPTFYPHPTPDVVRVRWLGWHVAHRQRLHCCRRRCPKPHPSVASVCHPHSTHPPPLPNPTPFRSPACPARASTKPTGTVFTNGCSGAPPAQPAGGTSRSPSQEPKQTRPAPSKLLQTRKVQSLQTQITTPIQTQKVPPQAQMSPPPPRPRHSRAHPPISLPRRRPSQPLLRYWAMQG